MKQEIYFNSDSFSSYTSQCEDLEIYKIKLDSLPDISESEFDEEYINFLESIFRKNHNFVLFAFMKHDDDKFKFIYESYLEFIVSARKAGLKEINAFYVDTPKKNYANISR